MDEVARLANQSGQYHCTTVPGLAPWLSVTAPHPQPNTVQMFTIYVRPVIGDIV